MLNAKFIYFVNIKKINHINICRLFNYSLYSTMYCKVLYECLHLQRFYNLNPYDTSFGNKQDLLY